MVQRSGTLSYFEGPQSGHWALFIDIQDSSLQHKLQGSPISKERALHSGNPELVSAYQNVMKKYYTDHKMVERIDNLFQNYKTMPLDALRSELQKWDADQGRAISLGERSLSHPPKQYQWSPKLRNAAIMRLYWKLRLRELTHSCNYHSTFTRWQQRVQAQDSSFIFPHLSQPLSIEQVRVFFNRATHVFRACQKSAIPLRIQTYQDLLASYSTDTNPSSAPESCRKAQIVRKTIDGEVIRNHFQDIRRVVKPSQNSSVSKILVPRDGDGACSSDDSYRILQEMDPQDLLWETVVDQKEMEKHILTYNRDSFRAADESPLGHGVIYDALTFSSLSPASSSLFLGEFPKEWHNDGEVMREFLASFTIPERVRKKGDIPSLISEDDIRKGFGTWKESTSTSPSGRHLGHYKAIVQDPILLQCLTKFMNIAIQSGISVPRWSNAITVLLEKDPGQPRIHRLRIIHLI